MGTTVNNVETVVLPPLDHIPTDDWIRTLPAIGGGIA